MSTPANPFVPDSFVRKPGIIGARWWNKAVQEGQAGIGRRAAMTTALWVGGGVLALGAVTVWAASKSPSSSSYTDEKEQWKSSLEVQRDYGWNFGAVSETVAFDVAYTEVYARTALATLEQDLAPTNPEHKSLYVPSLFQSPEALPRLTIEGETNRVKPLAEALHPINTPDMGQYERMGRAYAELIIASKARLVSIVDLPGHLAVAFAAGAAERLDPVFIFDNWPHPRGVVKSHTTLAAAVYHQPHFRERAAQRLKDAPALFVLDRGRLASYTDDVAQFDNRYMAKLPSSLGAAAAAAIYVVDSATTDLPELADLGEIFRGWPLVRALALQSFVDTNATKKDGTPTNEYLFGGSAQHASFHRRYPKADPSLTVLDEIPQNKSAEAYKPTTTAKTPQPFLDSPGIGYVPVVILATGAVIGSRFNRSGTWNRTAYNSGGG